MSVQKVYYVRCDGCRRLGSDGEGDVTAARREAKRRGWTRVPRGPGAPNYGRGADYCARCFATVGRPA